ncbi:MAG: branched-chain amino acid transaminase [Dehalococcoidales bacterium]|nr:branched-chain amino acid transaminase [Dehalococcoidales bacterium]
MSYAFLNKKFIPLEDAKVGIMTHALHYGTAVFEGIRGNWNGEKKQIYIFRLKEHYERLAEGSALLQMKLPYSVDELCKITVDMVKKSKFKEDIYIRPLSYKSTQAMGVRLHNLENDFLVFAIPWGRYIDKDACRCCISSWRRPADNVIPPSAKITGLYINNALTKSEAISRGYDEGIMLSQDGFVSEGSGENIFVVKNGKIFTPTTKDSILKGITRDTIMTLASNELGINVIEKKIGLVELYDSDECFLTGTAAHLTPVTEIENKKIGTGQPGEITGKLQKLYFDVIKGKNEKYIDWCTPVY